MHNHKSREMVQVLKHKSDLQFCCDKSAVKLTVFLPPLAALALNPIDLKLYVHTVIHIDQC